MIVVTSPGGKPDSAVGDEAAQRDECWHLRPGWLTPARQRWTLPRSRARRQSGAVVAEATVGESLPLFPLGTVLFPGMLLPLHLFEERYRRLMRHRHGTEPIFGVVLTRRGREVGEQPEIHPVGTAATLVGAGRYPDGRWDVVVRGVRRFRVECEDWGAGYLTGTVSWLDEPLGPAAGRAVATLVAAVNAAWDDLLSAIAEAGQVEVSRDDLGDDPLAVAYAICARLPLDTWERQRLLEAPTTCDRLRHLLVLLRREHGLMRQTGAGGLTIERPGRRFSAN
jgi:Lon protease-like protein